MKFDIVSDLHLDYYLSRRLDLPTYLPLILPPSPSRTLLIAGDLSHSNSDIENFLRAINDYYEHVILVLGNHDFYVYPGSISSFKTSLHRVDDLQNRLAKLKHIHLLTGQVVTVDGINFGGTSSFYDFSFGISYFGLTHDQMYYKWMMNPDSVNIIGLFENPLDFFWSEYQKLESLISRSDVIITHVNPDHYNIPARYNVPESGFFSFDGEVLLTDPFSKVRAWVYGHTHVRADYLYENSSTRMLNASLGYPHEIGDRRIRTIEL